MCVSSTHIVSEVHAIWDVGKVVADVLGSLGWLLAADLLVLFVLLVKVLHEAGAVLLRLFIHHPRVHS